MQPTPSPSRIDGSTIDRCWAQSVPTSIDYQGKELFAIGQGFQYTVYADDNSVRKIPLTFEQVLERFANLGHVPEASQLRKEQEGAMETIRRVGRALTNGELPNERFGNASVDSELVITMDRVIPIASVFKQATLDQQQLTVDRYIDMVLELLDYHLLETGYSMLHNHGVDSKGNPVILDFGEITFDHSVALRSVSRRPWANDRGGVKELQPKSKILSYYLEQMKDRITVPALEHRWKS